MLLFEPFQLAMSYIFDSRWIFKGVYGLPAPWRVNKRPMPIPFEVWSFFFQFAMDGTTKPEASIPNDSSSDSEEDVAIRQSQGSHGTESFQLQIQQLMPQLAQKVSQMEVLHPEVLRVTYAFQALQRFGRVFRVDGDFYHKSRKSEKIKTFWSHSWHGSSWKKILTLIAYYNSRVAICFGTSVAFLMALLHLLGFFARNHSRIRLAMGTFLHMVHNPWYRGCRFDLGIMAPHDPGIFGPHLHQFRCETQGADHPEPVWFTQGIKWDADFVGSKLDGKVMVFVRACCLSEKQRKDKSKAGYQTNRSWSGINRLFLYLCCDVCSNGRGAHWQCGTLGNPHVSHISICCCSVIPSLQHDACLFSITGCHGKAVIVGFLCHNQKRMLWHGTCFFIRATYDLWQRSGSRMHSHMVWYGGNFWRYFALGGSDDSKGWPMWQGIHRRVDYGSHCPSVLGWPWLCCIICQDQDVGSSNCLLEGLVFWFKPVGSTEPRVARHVVKSFAIYLCSFFVFCPFWVVWLSTISTCFQAMQCIFQSHRMVKAQYCWPVLFGFCACWCRAGAVSCL